VCIQVGGSAYVLLLDTFPMRRQRANELSKWRPLRRVPEIDATRPPKLFGRVPEIDRATEPRPSPPNRGIAGARRDSAPRDPAPRESAPRESAPRESAPRDSPGRSSSTAVPHGRPASSSGICNTAPLPTLEGRRAVICGIVARPALNGEEVTVGQFKSGR